MLGARTTFAILIISCLVGCALSTGQQGKLGFAYHASDTLFSNSLDHQIAVGGEVDILVYAPKDSTDKGNYVTVNDERKLQSGKSESVAVEDASSSKPAILKVLAIKGKRIRLQGLAPGVSELSVKTARGSDTIQIRVAKLDHAQVDHWTWKNAGATGPVQSVLLSGGVVHFSVRRVGAEGTPLVGYKISDAVAVSPSAAATWLDRNEDSSHARFRIGAHGPVTVSPKSGTALAFDVVKPEAIHSLRLKLEPAGALSVGAGAFLMVLAQIEDGRPALALNGVVSLISKTPNVCEASDLSEIAGDGLFMLKAKSPGECHVVATLAKLKAEVVLQVHP